MILSSAEFSKLTLSKNSLRFTIKVANSLHSDQTRHFVGPDLDPNCLHRLSADDTGGQRVNCEAAYSSRILIKDDI